MSACKQDRETRDIDGNSIQCKVALCNCFVATRWALLFIQFVQTRQGTWDTNVAQQSAGTYCEFPLGTPFSFQLLVNYLFWAFGVVVAAERTKARRTSLWALQKKIKSDFSGVRFSQLDPGPSSRRFVSPLVVAQGLWVSFNCSIFNTIPQIVSHTV